MSRGVQTFAWCCILLHVFNDKPSDNVCFSQLSIEKAQAIAEQVELKAKVVQSEVKTTTLRHKKALEERECELLWKVNGHLVLSLCGEP